MSTSPTLGALTPKYAIGLVLQRGGLGTQVAIEPPTQTLVLQLAKVFKGEQGEPAPASFETVSKNLKGMPYVLGYTGDALTSITYTTPAGAVTKTMAYTAGALTSITLSGAGLPAGVQTTKTLSYTAGKLTGVTYS